jgi:hypothetical protein
MRIKRTIAIIVLSLGTVLGFGWGIRSAVKGERCATKGEARYDRPARTTPKTRATRGRHEHASPADR